MRIASPDFKIAAALAMAGLLAAGTAALSRSPVFEAKTAIRVDAGSGDPLALEKSVGEIKAETTSRRTLRDAILRQNLYPELRREGTLEDAIDRMKKAAVVTPLGTDGEGAARVEVRFTYPDGARAQAAIRQMVEAGGGAMAEQPSLARAGLSRESVALGGAAAGLLLGVLMAGLRRWPAPIACGLTGALLAAALTYAFPGRYVSTARVRISRAEYAKAALEALAGTQWQAPQAEAVQDPLGVSEVFVRCANRDRFAAQAAASKAVASIFTAATRKAREAKDYSDDIAEVVEAPGAPEDPALPHPAIGAGIGLAAGLLLSPLAMRARRRAACAARLA